jgi:EAL domain-containing protein (putative c-di-GMP-specific phosphodiesterase class I)
VTPICLGDNSESDAIVHAVTGLADSLRMTTTAEGVETRAQLDIVRKLGCTDVQGFYYSPPVPAHALAKILAMHSSGQPVPPAKSVAAA